MSEDPKDDREPVPEPDLTKLTLALRRWLSGVEADWDERTVILRSRSSSALEKDSPTLEEIQAAGAQVQTTGPGSATVVVTLPALARLTRIDAITAIQEPRPMNLKSPL